MADTDERQTTTDNQAQDCSSGTDLCRLDGHLCGGDGSIEVRDLDGREIWDYDDFDLLKCGLVSLSIHVFAECLEVTLTDTFYAGTRTMVVASTDSNVHPSMINIFPFAAHQSVCIREG